MKNCPNCGIEVDQGFDACWNCLYEFQTGETTLPLVCARCNVEFESIDVYREHAATCQPEFENQVDGGDQQIDCLRCRVRMEYRGNYAFHEGTRIGILGDFFELFQNRESFNLYVCPRCGKVEFFIPQTD